MHYKTLLDGSGGKLIVVNILVNVVIYQARRSFAFSNSGLIKTLLTGIVEIPNKPSATGPYNQSETTIISSL